jgi:hypothetical protein
MSSTTTEIASLLGATIAGRVPETGGGAFGAARLSGLAASLQARLEPGEGRRPGRPTDASWVRHPKIPMSEETAHRLARLAELASTPERRVSPMQVAAQLLEEAVARCTTQNAEEA